MRRTVVSLTLVLLALAVARTPCGPGAAQAHAEPHAAVASRGEDCQDVLPAAPAPAWQPVAALATAPFVPAGPPRTERLTGTHPTFTAVSLIAPPLRL